MSDDEDEVLSGTERVARALIGDTYRQDTYHKALGEFIAKFAVVESIMQMALRHFAGVQTPIAESLFSGTRAKAAADYIKRIGQAQKWSKDRQKEWKYVVDQFSHLQSLRNDVVHYGAVWRGSDVWIASNQLYAHTKENITNLPASPEVLKAATADLGKIARHVVAFTWPERLVGAPPKYQASLKRAWRYKPPPQAGRPQKTRGKSQER